LGVAYVVCVLVCWCVFGCELQDKTFKGVCACVSVSVCVACVCVCVCVCVCDLLDLLPTATPCTPWGLRA
jgi:hypothetical protein